MRTPRGGLPKNKKRPPETAIENMKITSGLRENGLQYRRQEELKKLWIHGIGKLRIRYQVMRCEIEENI